MNEQGGDEAGKLAMRYNNLLFGLFGGWLAVLVMFWLRAWGPLLSFDAEPLTTSVPTWFALGLAGGGIAAMLPRSYYRPRAFERSGDFYRRIGIRAFRASMSDGDWINRHVRERHPGYRVHGGAEGLASALERGFRSELSHHVLFWFGLATSLCAGFGGWLGWALTIGLGNLVGNLYPIFLQRYTRGRIARIRPRLIDQFVEGRHG